MLFKRNDLIWKCGLKVEDAKVICSYQKELEILNDNNNEFSVDCRQLYQKLKVKTEFSKWILRRIEKYGFEEDVDYILKWVNTSVVKNDDLDSQRFAELSPQELGRLGYRKEYFLTIGMAKELCMVENNDFGRITRKYFILCEKVLKELYEWNMIRTPEKTLYKEMCEELRLFRLRNYNKETKPFHYMNEANSINIICLGAKAKDIRDYIDAQDKNTRDWLDKQYNTYLCKIQELNILYLKMNMDKERRYDMLKQSFSALYPNANFVMANKDLIKNIKEGKYL